MKANERRGRPIKGSSPLTERFELRMAKKERQAFEEAAELAGLDLSSWIRTRLRTVALKELREAEKAIAFMTTRKS